MARRRKVLVSWSSGKDSAWTLCELLCSPEIDIAGLLTTFNQEFDRVAMHGVRRRLVEAQAAAAGIPLWPVVLPWPCPNAEYERIMRGVCATAVANGIEAIAFGDLFLADIREYRERQLAGTGLQPLFPLWGRPTRELAAAMIEAGVRARIACANPRVLPRHFAGCDFDRAFLAALPAGIDPCGENGEFHTFVSAAPCFRREVNVACGDIVERDGFVFADLLPAWLSKASR